MSTLVTTALRHNTSASNNITLDSNGRVGIGTATPAVTLSVNSGSTDEIARFDGSSVVNPYVSLYRQGTRMGYWYAPSATYMELAAEGRPLYLTATGAQSILFNNNSNTRMTIDSSGRVTMPGQPMASGGPGGAGAWTTGGYVAPLTAHVNIGGHMNTTTGVFTAPVAGRYYVYVGLLHNTTWYVYVHVNSGASSFLVSHGNVYTTAGGAVIVNLQANDTIRFNTSGTYYNNSHGSYAIYLLS